MPEEDDVLANSFMYVQSDIPEGMTLSAYRASRPLAAGPSNKAYALALAFSAGVVALPNLIAAIVRRHA